MNRKILFYHYKPLKCLDHLIWLQNYLNRKIWLTRLDSFNDKFEGRFIYEPVSADEILNSPELFDRYYCYLKESDPGLTKEAFIKKLRTPDAEKLIGKPYIVDNYLQSHGALCLTLSGSNIPMWAHYANNYQGYCIVFELDLKWIYENGGFTSVEYFDQYINDIMHGQEILSFSSKLDTDKHFVLTKVSYQSQFPKIKEANLQKIMNEVSKTGLYYEHTKYIVQNSVGVKFEQWNYEGEYRLIANTNSGASSLMDLRGYPFLKVTEVIMGEEIGKNLDQDISDFLKSVVLNEQNIPGDNVSEVLKNFIYQQAEAQQIEVFIAKNSLNSYKVDKEKYNPSKPALFKNTIVKSHPNVANTSVTTSAE